jgi:GntR family transcriptional regulator, transcriptional repressor for pyruvate dehydrogenase complex
MGANEMSMGASEAESEDTSAPALSVQRVRPAYEQVASQLRDLIIRGEIGSGDRLPVESELPALFGVSRSTIREALRVLSSQNLITTRRGVRGGTFVVKPERDDVRDFLETSLGLMTVDDALTIDELIEVRELLEVPGASLAATRRTKLQVETLQAMVNGTDPSSSPKVFEETSRFHEYVFECAGNGLLEMMLGPIFKVLDTRIDRNAASPKFWKEVAEDHREIAAAIEAGDAAAAGECMMSHLEHLRAGYPRLDRKGEVPHRNGDQ